MTSQTKSQEELMTKERSYVFETRVDDAKQCKELGAEAHKADERNRAIQFYERALYHVDFDEATWAFELLDNHRDAVNEVRLPVYLNLAACHLALDNGDMQKVIENCDLALQIDKDNVKALYRKGQAYLNTNDLDAAVVVLKKAVALNPTDKAIRQSWTTCKEKLEVAKAEEKKRWGGRLLDESAKKPSVAADEDDTASTSTAPQAAAVESPTSSLVWVVAGLLPALAALVAYLLWGL